MIEAAGITTKLPLPLITRCTSPMVCVSNMYSLGNVETTVSKLSVAKGKACPRPRARLMGPNLFRRRRLLANAVICRDSSSPLTLSFALVKRCACR